MSEYGFIKNKKLLEESSCIDSLIDLDLEIEKFSIKLDNIDLSSIIWFVGRFWSWKSNFLNQVKSKKIDSGKWINFDAWRYLERQNLWENFVLEFARQINQEVFDATIKKLIDHKAMIKKLSLIQLEIFLDCQ